MAGSLPSISSSAASSASLTTGPVNFGSVYANAPGAGLLSQWYVWVGLALAVLDDIKSFVENGVSLLNITRNIGADRVKDVENLLPVDLVLFNDLKYEGVSGDCTVWRAIFLFRWQADVFERK